MIHIGIDLSEQADEARMDDINQQMLDELEAGDILTHVYTAKIGSVIKPHGRMLPGLKEAIERGAAEKIVPLSEIAQNMIRFAQHKS